jgi:Domain of unknown function (DUF4268)
MSDDQLGKLERVDLRLGWPHEAVDFTPWLALDENIAQLSEAIGIDLEVVDTEVGVGAFSADLHCKDTLTGQWVVIENQLEQTDHDHLGKSITYAAGLEASTIVWIAAELRDEHRAALDWLNEATGERYSFFGIELELFKIGSSALAPHFKIGSAPNDWTKFGARNKTTPNKSSMTPRQALFYEYWTSFSGYVDALGPTRSKRKSSTDSWMGFSIGRSNFNLSALLHPKRDEIEVHLYTMEERGNKPFYHLLLEEKNEIEADAGLTLDWKEKPKNKSSQIAITLKDASLEDRDRWEEYHAWMLDKIHRMDKALRPRIKLLDASKWSPPEEQEDV